MKFGAHQTFHLKASWLHKGLLAINSDPKILSRSTAIEKLGMGKNMVESLRYWLEATQLAERKEGRLGMTTIAKKILAHDRFVELDGTLQVVHYLLASNEDEATVWHWFFNKFSASEFDVDSLNIYLGSHVSTNADKKVKGSTLAKDINCLLRMYRSENYDQKYDPEKNNPALFSKFGWIEQKNAVYARRRLKTAEISPLIFVFTLYLFWITHLQEAESISIEDIANRDCSPGLIFGLSLEQCSEMIEVVTRKYPGKYLTHNKSGGYYIVSLEKKAQQALRHYYDENQIGMK